MIWKVYMEINENNITSIVREVLSNIKLESVSRLETPYCSCSSQIKGKEINIESIDIKQTIINILSEINNSLLEINKNKVQELIELLNLSDRIFIAGYGRSGLICKAFAMRLMQIGLNVFVVGETTTPAIKSRDLLISVSGSGRTEHSYNIMKKAKDYGAYSFLITANNDSPMAEIADSFILIVAPTKLQINTINVSSQLIGSLFEQSTFILFESIIDIISKSLDLKFDDIMIRHANLE